MNAALTDLLAYAQDGLLIGFIVFLRVGTAMALLPAFGESSVPQRVRLGLALGFTAIVMPAVAAQIEPLAEHQKGIPILLATETLAGLALGIALRLFVLALQMAGSIAAQATSLSQVFGGTGIEPQPAIGHLLVFGGLALAVMTGLHVRIAEVLILSYNVLTPGQFPGASILGDWGVGQIAQAFSLAFTLAAPFIIASLIYNVALGVINRAMPQLMVAFVGAPAITAGALILMFLVMPLMLTVWSDALQQFLQNPFGGPK
ncbi:flagellar biosynthetic protein FliR [Profundibacter amoris]|uniref:Type III secretion protein n=1 Tax=Profundibacter amoris TaxID=2171755 RepID=A0A347UL75_9RHOB|nr:flagellar biosynthetic protein FliR [Profundibacter amoris]AXX99603.1 type III secretion protein [Profundibacter amoris]